MFPRLRAPRRPLPRRFALPSVALLALLLLGSLAACDGPSTANAVSTVPKVAPTATPPDTATAAVALATLPPTATADQPTNTATASAAASASPTDAPTQASAQTPTIAAVDQASFTQQVNDLIANAGGTVELVVELADGTVIYDQDGSDSMESASLYKLGIMVELYRQRDAGLISFDDTVELYPGFFSEGADVYTEDEIGSYVTIGDLLTNMITLSSNVAATALLYTAGTDNINNTLASLGLNSTEIRWTPGLDLAPDSATDDSSGGDSSSDDPAPSDDSSDPSDSAPTDSTDPNAGDPTPTGLRSGIVLTAAHSGPRAAQLPAFDARADAALNVTTAEDVASLYMQLLNGQVVDAQASQEMLDLLSQQEINDRLPALLPDGTVVAHKTGNLDGLVHDAGVIYAPGGPIIVAALTENLDDDVANDLISQIGLLAYELASQ